ncbi:hypothetical protein [Chitinibacter tainanensis]|nr:hypothetical protein [Chitinibacter tainanensis]
MNDIQLLIALLVAVIFFPLLILPISAVVDWLQHSKAARKRYVP